MTYFFWGLQMVEYTIYNTLTYTSGKIFDLAWWSGGHIWNWYFPPPLTDMQQLRLQYNTLIGEVDELKYGKLTILDEDDNYLSICEK